MRMPFDIIQIPKNKTVKAVRITTDYLMNLFFLQKPFSDV